MSGAVKIDATQDLLDLAYNAWVVIANAGRGTWLNEAEEWQSAAINWREQFHAALDRYGKSGEVPHAD